MTKHKPLYAIFARDSKGTLMSFCENSLDMSWTTNLAATWEYPPVHYFRPQDGHFIVKLSKQHPDIVFTGRHGRRTSNKEWKLKDV